VPAVRNFGLKEVSLNQIELQVGFYPFRGPEASLTLAQAYHTARGVLLRCSLSVERFARFWMPETETSGQSTSGLPTNLPE